MGDTINYTNSSHKNERYRKSTLTGIHESWQDLTPGNWGRLVCDDIQYVSGSSICVKEGNLVLKTPGLYRIAASFEVTTLGEIFSGQLDVQLRVGEVRVVRHASIEPGKVVPITIELPVYESEVSDEVQHTPVEVYCEVRGVYGGIIDYMINATRLA